MTNNLVHVSKLVCIGRNYAAHARELNNEIPKSPVVFLKPPSSLVDTGKSVVIPRQSNDVHHEVELVAEIGRRCKHVSEDDALDYVRSYAVGLDMTARDIQSLAKAKGLPWSVAKGFDTFAPLGPLFPARSIDPADLEIRLDVNGETRQLGSTSLMLFSLPRLIAFCSSVFTLEEGDLLYTGTPKGVARVKAGDRLVASITGLPQLEVDVVDEST